VLFDKELEEIEKAPVVLSFIQNDRGEYEKAGESENLLPIIHPLFSNDIWAWFMQTCGSATLFAFSQDR
jgi:hypothetical protein